MTNSIGAERALIVQVWQAPGGEGTGPDPTDQGKIGSKLHVLTDTRGIPPAILVSSADRDDSMLFEPLLVTVKAIAGLAGSPRQCPDKVHADKPYDGRKCRAALRLISIKGRIAKRGVGSN